MCCCTVRRESKDRHFLAFGQAGTVRQDDDAMTVARQWDGANESLFAEVPKVAFAWVTRLAVVVLQVTCWNNAEDAIYDEEY